MSDHPLIRKNKPLGPTQVGKHTVETWYDRSSRNWVTQTKDAEGNETTDASYDGTRKDATRSHEYHKSNVPKDE